MLEKLLGGQKNEKSDQLKKGLVTIMKFQIVSDLHIERFHPRVPSIKDFITPEAPYLIMAGDIGRVELWDQFSSFIVETCHHFKTVIFVSGNHEYYTGNQNLAMSEIDKKLTGIKKMAPNFQYLNNQTCFFGKRTMIFGTTFWSKVPDVVLANRPYPIYTSPGNRINSTFYNMLHYQSRVKLEEAIREAKKREMNLVVVSHYSPTFQGTLAPKYRQPDLKNHLYCTKCDDYLENKKMSIWIYAHTGFNNDKTTPGGTRLVSNQNRANKFSKNFVINVWDQRRENVVSI